MKLRALALSTLMVMSVLAVGVSFGTGVAAANTGGGAGNTAVSYSSASISPTTLPKGSAVDANITVSNSDSSQQTYNVSVSVDGTVEQWKNGTVAANSNTNIWIQETLWDVGDHTVTVAGGSTSASETVTIEAANPKYHGGPRNLGHYPNQIGPTREPVEQWNISDGTPHVMQSTIVNGTLYTAFHDGGQLYALDPETGAVKWSATPGGTSGSTWTTPAYANGVLYIGSNDYKLHAIDAENGNELWNYQTQTNVRSAPAVVDGVVYFGSNNRNMTAVNATTGEELWHHTLYDPVLVESNPAVVDGVVYFGSGNSGGGYGYGGNVTALNATTGDLVWKYSVPIGIQSDATVVNDTVFIGDDNGNVYALNATDGTKRWDYTLSGEVDSGQVYADGTLYASSRGGNLTALNASDGTLKWEYTGRDFRGAPIVVDDVVYVMDFGNASVHAFNATDGTELWAYDSPTGNLYATPLVWNDTLYYGSGSAFYALAEPAPSITNVTVTNPSAQNLEISFDSSLQLSTISVSISGAESATLTESDFTESGSGPFTYTASYSGSTNGDYTATVDTAIGPDGRDGASGESDNASISITQITDWNDLNNVRNDLDGDYVLASNLDKNSAGYSSVASGSANGGAGFDPIGDSSTPFTGTFDGNDFTIANLTIDRPGEDFVGLFGNVSTTGTIENVSLEAVAVTGGQETGGLAGRSNGVVSRSSVEGTVDGSDWVGVVVGTNYGTVTETYATGSATVDTQDVGGLAGWNNGTIEDSYANSTVTGPASYTDSGAGGLVGQNKGTVARSYATGGVSTGAGDVGGLTGVNSGSVTDSYWDANTTGQPTSAGGTGLTTSQLKANTSLAFDFTNTWGVVDNATHISYPYLLNNAQSPAPGLATAGSGTGDLYAGGSGTDSDPYEIANWTHLDNVRQNLGANFTLVADLNATTAGYDSVASPSANGGAGFDPIGTFDLSKDTEFTGTFDGTGHIIENLTIGRSTEDYVGLFGAVESNGKVANTSLDASVIDGSSRVGSLIGLNYGLVKHSYVTGTVTGSKYVGGLVGVNRGTLTRSYTTGNVTGSEYVGGLVGQNHDTLNRSYVSGNVTGSQYVGGLVGQNLGTVADVYWDENTTGRSAGIGFNGGSTTNVTGLSTAELKGDPAKTNTNFDFQNTWDVLDNSSHVSYPYLLQNTQQPAPGLATADSGTGDLYAGGSGTDSDPYQIENWNHLNNTRQNLDASFTLVADLDENTAGYDAVHDAQKGFDPIGGYSTGFTGTFDGNGSTMADLTIDRPAENETALFRYVGASGTLTDVTVENASISGNWETSVLVGDLRGSVTESIVSGTVSGVHNVGGLVGYSWNGTVTNASANVTVTGTENLGGLVGLSDGSAGEIRSSHAIGDVTGSGDWVGGLVGELLGGGVVEDSYASGAVSGRNQVGGLLGRNEGSVIDSNASGQVNGTGDYVGGLVGSSPGSVENATASGDVNGTAHVGGLVGWLSSNVTESTATGAVTGDGTYVGGLAGELNGSHVVENSHASGTVSGGDQTGGLLGRNEGSVLDSTATGNVTSTEDYVGGLVGSTLGPLRNVSASGDVTGNGTSSNTVGGLAGYSEGSVSNATASGSVSGTGEEIGGLIGRLHSGAVLADSTATGTVTGSDYNTGGLVGQNGGTISASVAAGDVTGTINAGGLVGVNLGIVNRSAAIGNVTGERRVGGIVGGSTGTLLGSNATGAVTGTRSVGGLVGAQLGGSIRASNASGPITGNQSVGGLVGANGAESLGPGGTIEHSTASGSVTAKASATVPTQFGGLVGQNYQGTVTTSNATGDVIAGDATSVGGLVGYTNGTGASAVVNVSYATGNVSGAEDVGGLVGTSLNTTVNQTYATGSVTGDRMVGGLAGNATGSNNEVANSFAAGTVSATGTPVGGLIGNTESTTVTDAYWDVNTTGQDTSAGNATGLTTSQLKANTSLAFDFGTTWDIKTGTEISYPYLLNNTQSPTPGLGTIDTTPPSISTFSVTNPSGQDVQVSFDADEQLSTIEVALTGTESATLTTSDFTETDNGEGTYTYEATYAGSSDGNYAATLETAEDTVGNDGASGQSDTVEVDTSDDGDDGGDGDDGDDGDNGDTTTEENDGDTTTEENDGDTTTEEDDGETTTEEDDGDTTTEEDDGETPTDEEQPSGETTAGERWVEPSELQTVNIVDVRLETEPANSVKTTSIVTLENPATIDRTVDVRFVIDGEVAEERAVTVPAEERLNATYTEIVETAGTHEVAANVGTETEDGGFVRTFDFTIGTVELDQDGTEIASSSADLPWLDAQDESAAGESDDAVADDSDDGSGILHLIVGIGIVALVVVVLVGAYVRRRKTA
ncbi:GLUG motif-containing protein [Halorhabdus amylolytica]|uniref:GLUG motif-containing protein n=1 Tax=Halorhabdus amylolytica TaxID=2559573 RepID=UPI0010A9BF53|nr:GLUG motif-containing protein [Halorhabdus amylolytica]